MKLNAQYRISSLSFGMRRRAIIFAFWFLPFAFCLAPPVPAQNWETSGPPKQERAASGRPKLLENVSIEQKLDQQVPLDLVFRDEAGNTVKLGDYFGTKPVVL